MTDQMTDETATLIIMVGLVFGLCMVGLLVFLVVKTGESVPPLPVPVDAMWPLTVVAAYNLLSAVVVWAGVRNVWWAISLGFPVAVLIAWRMSRVWDEVNRGRFERLGSGGFGGDDPL